MGNHQFRDWIKVVFPVVVALMVPLMAFTHEVRPAFLQLTETEAGSFDVLWKVPVKNNTVPKISPVFPKSFKVDAPEQPDIINDAAIWHIQLKGDLEGQPIAIDGLSRFSIDVLVRIGFADGRSYVELLQPKESSFVVPAKESMGGIAWNYLTLGIEHILRGPDHLLFILALLLVTVGTLRLVKAVTSFTIAHSITLSLATLGFVHFPSAPVEAVIALSIVFLAVELVHQNQGREGLTAKSPWIVAFTFGLLHGLGFAGALADVGLPQTAIPVALLLFNVGVEIGQLMFIAMVLLVLLPVKRIEPYIPAKAKMIPVYGIGGVAAFWLIERVVAFW